MLLELSNRSSGCLSVFLATVKSIVVFICQYCINTFYNESLTRIFSLSAIGHDCHSPYSFFYESSNLSDEPGFFKENGRFLRMIEVCRN